MAIWLADPKFTIIYIDTDCLVMIQTMETSPDLWAYKLENIYPIVVFLGPKSYGGILENGKVFTKVKGFSTQV